MLVLPMSKKPVKTATSKLTTKYQATIPEPVRKVLHLGSGDVIAFDIEDCFFNLTNTPVDVYDTSGAASAAMGAEIGMNNLKMSSDNFTNLQPIKKVIPEKDNELEDQFSRWEVYLKNHIIHD